MLERTTVESHSRHILYYATKYATKTEMRVRNETRMPSLRVVRCNAGLAGGGCRRAVKLITPFDMKSLIRAVYRPLYF